MSTFKSTLSGNFKRSPVWGQDKSTLFGKSIVLNVLGVELTSLAEVGDYRTLRSYCYLSEVTIPMIDFSHSQEFN